MNNPLGYIHPASVDELRSGQMPSAPIHSSPSNEGGPELLPVYLGSDTAALLQALEAMRPHIAKIKYAATVNDEMGRVLVGQTEAARELARIFEEAMGHD